MPGVTPDPERTFNRGYTEYFTKGREKKILSPHTPKSLGKRIGIVVSVEGNRFCIEGNEKLTGGDGIFFFKHDGSGCGTRINRVDESFIYPLSMDGIHEGTVIFRNNDASFEKAIESAQSQRRITADMLFRDTAGGYELVMTDTDGISVSENVTYVKEKSLKAQDQNVQIEKQLAKLGNTIFASGDVSIEFEDNWFVPVSLLNELRRSCTEKLETERLRSYIRPESIFNKTDIQYPYTEIDYTWNVSNSLARKFYERHGVSIIGDSFETGIHTGNEALMTTKMCLKYENGLCSKYGGNASGYTEPFILSDGVHRFKINFDCSRCVMIIRLYY